MYIRRNLSTMFPLPFQFVDYNCFSIPISVTYPFFAWTEIWKRISKWCRFVKLYMMEFSLKYNNVLLRKILADSTYIVFVLKFCVKSCSYSFKILTERKEERLHIPGRTSLGKLVTTLRSSHRMHTTTAWLRDHVCYVILVLNTLRTGDADLRFYITTVQDGWRKSAFLTRACFPPQYT